MAQKVEKIDFKYTKEAFEELGYPLKKLAEETGVSESSLRKYFSEKSFPAHIAEKLTDILNPKNEVVWAKMEVSIPVTADELYAIMRMSELNHLRHFDETGFDDAVLSDEIVRIMLKRATPDGKCYIPSLFFIRYKDWYEEEKARRIRMFFDEEV